MATSNDSINFQFTAQGQQLATQALAGNTKLDFTKAVASTDNHFSDDAATIAALTTLGHVKQTATITEVETVTNDDTEVRIPVTFDKSQVGDDYQLLSVGLYCKPDDGDEVLYAVAGLANPILMHQSVAGSVYSIALYVLVGTAENVTIKVDPAGSITQADLTAILAEYVKSADIKTVAYTDKPNVFTQQQTLSAGAVDADGHAYVTEDKVPKTDLSGLQPKGDYATNTDLTALKTTVTSTTTGLPSKASSTDLATLKTQVTNNTTAIGTKMATVDVNQQLDKKVNVADMRKPASDVAGIEEVNAKQDKIGYTPADDSKVVHDNHDGTIKVNGHNINPFDTVQNDSQPYGLDFNNYIHSGNYRFDRVTTINYPPMTTRYDYWQLVVLGDGNSAYQMATGHGITATRQLYVGTGWGSWMQVADDSTVAHLSGANNFDTVPTVNNNPLLLASSLPSDLARTGKDANFTGKLQKSGIDVATTTDVSNAVSTATTDATNKANSAQQAAINQAKIDLTSELTKRGYPSAIWTGTQAQYDAMASHDANTEYRITG